MADGAVLEHGTHNELCADSRSMYSQLVQAQRLRDGKEHDDSAASAREDNKSTGGLLSQSASTSLDSLQKEILPPGPKMPVLGIIDLFIKLAKLNRESWRKYMIGSVFAVSECCPSETIRPSGSLCRSDRHGS
jgi:hypothetical protein